MPDRDRRAARARCSTGGRARERRRALRERLRAARRRRSRRRDHEPRAARERGLTSTVTFPRGNLAPGGLGDQEHGDRSRRVVDADGVYRKTGPARVFTTRARRRSPRSRARGPSRIKPGDVLVLICRGPHGRGHGGDLPDHVRAQAPVVRQARRRAHRRALLRRLHRRLHRPRRPRGAGRRPDRQAARRRPDPDRRRPRTASRARVDLVGHGGRDVRPRGGRARAGGAAAAARTSRPTPSCPTTRGSGRRCRQSAAAPGAAASTTSTRSWPPSAAEDLAEAAGLTERHAANFRHPRNHPGSRLCSRRQLARRSPPDRHGMSGHR